MKLFIRHPRHFLGIISCSYPLSNDQLYRYQEKLLWGQTDIGFYHIGLSGNSRLSWSVEMLEVFLDRWDWNGISCYIIGNHLWTADLLKTYTDRLDWNAISYNRNIPWDEFLLEQFSDRINWPSLSRCGSVPWTKDLIRKFEDHISFSDLSNNSSSPLSTDFTWDDERKPSSMTAAEIIDLVEVYEDKWDWDSLFWDWQKSLNRKQTDRIIERVMESIPAVEWPKASDTDDFDCEF